MLDKIKVKVFYKNGKMFFHVTIVYTDGDVAEHELEGVNGTVIVRFSEQEGTSNN